MHVQLFERLGRDRRERRKGERDDAVAVSFDDDFLRLLQYSRRPLFLLRVGPSRCTGDDGNDEGEHAEEAFELLHFGGEGEFLGADVGEA